MKTRKTPVARYEATWDDRKQTVHVASIAPDTTAELVAHDVRATGGSTRSITGTETPTTGYMVSLPGFEETFRYWSDETISDYISRHRNELTNSRRFVGAWIDDGTLYLDVSVWFSTEQGALAQARLGHQLAFWDLESQNEIRLDAIAA